MAEIKTQPVQAKRVDDIDDGDAAAGSFELFTANGRADAGMIFCCPCGCGDKSSINFAPGSPPAWEWDGNREAPTLVPSVHRVGHWHGFLTAGVWKSC